MPADTGSSARMRERLYPPGLSAGLGVAPLFTGDSWPHVSLAMSVTMSLEARLHVLQAALCPCFMPTGGDAEAYRAMLYFTGAMTTFGHAPLFLEPAWQMPGALAALNGTILFGPSTAFLYSVCKPSWPGIG